MTPGAWNPRRTEWGLGVEQVEKGIPLGVDPQALPLLETGVGGGGGGQEAALYSPTWGLSRRLGLSNWRDPSCPGQTEPSGWTSCCPPPTHLTEPLPQVRRQNSPAPSQTLTGGDLPPHRLHSPLPGWGGRWGRQGWLEGAFPHIPFPLTPYLQDRDRTGRPGLGQFPHLIIPHPSLALLLLEISHSTIGDGAVCDDPLIPLLPRWGLRW